MKPEEHAGIRELLGAYALDAVSPDEDALVEAHVRDCPQCRAEVDEHRETAAMLAGADPIAPQGVWERIAATLEDQPPRLDVARLRRGGPWQLGRWVAAAVAAALVTVVGFMGFRLVELGDRLDAVVAIGEREGLAEAAAAAALDPDSARVQLRSEAGDVIVSAVVQPDGTGYLIADELRALPAGRTYQLWGIRGDTPVSAGVLGPDPARVVPFNVSPDVAGLAISEERAGGSDSGPTLPAVVEGAMDRA
jgi:anti-sigma factor RsiW